MRIRHKKLLVSGAAVTVAGVLGIGTLIQTSLSVKASSEMMPGIETIINENSGQKPFKILELTDSSDRAEIGYYVSGQEPYIKLYTWQYTDENNETKTIHFNTLEEGLKLLPEGKRREFAMNIRLDADGNIDTTTSTGIRSVADISTGDAESSPLSVSDYQEKYFLESGDDASDWKQIDFTDTEGNSRTDTIQTEGSYQENTEGTGDYTKEQQTYYPIRSDKEDDGKNADTFRENIENFYFSEGSDDSSRGAYFLEFASVSNEKVNKAMDADGGKYDILPEYDPENQRYGYYENVYEDLTKEIVDNIAQGIYAFPGQNPSGDLTSAVLLADQPDEAVQRDPDEETTFGSGSEGADISSGETVSSPDSPAGGDDFSGGDTSGESQVSFDNEFTGDLSTEDGGFGDESTDEAVGADVSVDTTDADNTDNGDNSGADAFSDSASDFSTDVQTEDGSGETGDLSDQTEDQMDVQTGEEDTTSGILGEMTDEKAAGTQADPYVYLSESIDEYPYFKYTLIGDLEYVKEKAVDITTPEHQNETREAGDITLESDQYWYWKADDSGILTKYPITVVTGRQPVAYEDLKKIPDEIQYDYYFRVSKVWFCCTSDGDGSTPSDYKYTGWYFASYPQDQDPYLPVSGDEIPTHYISDAEYSLTPGTGSYDFVPGGDTKRIVQVNHMFYQGGYVNNDWFKKYVFHLTPKASSEDADGQFENFEIQVDTRSSENPEQEIYAIPADSEDTPSVGDASSEENAVADQTDDFSSEDTGEAVTADGEAEVTDAGSENTEVTDEDTDLDEVSTEDMDEAGAEAEELQTLMESYDLIYVNGALSETAAAAISQSSVPCIINNAYVSSEGQGALDGFSQTDDDGHYVNTYVYFFKNTLASGTEDASTLVNTQFHTNFNGNADGDSYEPSEEAKGFEEILEYIESENQYRALGSKDDSDVADGEDRKIDPLDKQISQARAIEYIINYKYKRYLKTKENIKVLEIEPCQTDARISASEVAGWVSDTKLEKDMIEKLEVCCYNKSENGEPWNMFDGKDSTIWHSAWGSEGNNWFNSSVQNRNDHMNKQETNKHWFEVTLKEAIDMDGFDYQPRGSNKNGALCDYTLELWDENDNLLDTITGDTNLANDFKSARTTYLFDKTVQGVKKFRLTYGATIANEARDNNKFAVCAEFGFIHKDVTVDCMTAAEFVGHRDDIASEYDMIYIGDYAGKRNGFLNGPGDTMLYAHVGAAVSSEVGLSFSDSDGRFNIGKLLGQLNNEWDSTFTPYGQYTGRLAPVSTYSENGAGYFRGSGNDMTRQQCEMLKDFVKSGYPVVLGDNLVTGEGTDRTIRTDKVDAASYYYEFLTDALKYDNIFTWDEADKGELNSFYVQLAKPVIHFTENGRPPEPQRANETNDGTDANVGNIDKELKYTFTVENDSDAAPASSTYDCKLYIDLNFDGVFSSKEVQDNYMTIADSSGKVLSQVSYGKDDQRYQLKIGQQYTVTRKIPSDYYKLITWKLVLTSNENTYIHTSETGYAKQNNPNGEKQTINVLQIIPDGGGNWRLAQDADLKKRLAQDVEDFNINVEEITVTNFANLADVKAKLATKQMLIIGFDDAYQNIPNDRGQVEAILEFVKSGKSIIFSHDTTSFQNYRYSEVYPKVARESYPEGDYYYKLPRDNWLQSRNPDWGLSVGSILRAVVGMDRYGITSTEQITEDMTVSQLLKQGKELNSSEVSFKELMRLAGDVAYKTGDASRSTSWAQTQGYTYKILQLVNFNGSAVTQTAQKVNDGAITQYPYRVGANNGTSGETIKVSNTHVQYYQLALEQDFDINGRSDGETDTVVWYCLGGWGYSDSIKDARNNYYYYSKGNVIYTGSGHQNAGSNEDEIELFINSIVAAANVTAVQPEVNFVKALDPSAATESSRYYMTDQSKWTQEEGNTLEKDMDFYINVKDYNMVSADLSEEDLSKQKMTVEFYIDDENGTSTSTGTDIRKLTNVTGAIGTLTEYGTGAKVSLSGNQFVLTQNNAYGFTMPDIEQYLRTSGNDYKKECRLYVKVSSTVYLYGSPVESTTWSYMDLKQRQLFELD